MNFNFKLEKKIVTMFGKLNTKLVCDLVKNEENLLFQLYSFLNLSSRKIIVIKTIKSIKIVTNT